MNWLSPPEAECSRGGVSDNQGIDGLLEEGLSKDEEYELIIVSDASGQIEQLDKLSGNAASVMPRTMSIFQHEIRNMELQKLVDWKYNKSKLNMGLVKEEDMKASFAFVHLFLDIKQRVSSTDRMPSEYIPALGRIRTDLDQFSKVEREALMYHGYTLVDAQLKEYCKNFLNKRKLVGDGVPALK